MPEVMHTIANHRGIQVRLEGFEWHGGEKDPLTVVWEWRNYDGGGRSIDSHEYELPRAEAVNLMEFLAQYYCLPYQKFSPEEVETIKNALAFTDGQGCFDAVERGHRSSILIKIK